MHFNFHYTFNLTKLFDPPHLPLKTFWSPLATQNFFGPLHFPQHPPPTKVFMNTPLLQKNVIVFFFENQISRWRLFEKAIFDLLFTFFIHHAGKSYTHIHAFCSPYWPFLPYQFWKKKYEFIRYGFSLVWVLVLILIRAILEQSINNKVVSKFELECLQLICVYTYAKFIVICKPRILNDGGNDSVQYRNRKKHCFLATAILLFIGKIIIIW